MKKSRMLITLSVILLASLAWAQVPQTINYQGVLKDNSGNIVADGNYELTFRLYDASAGGTEWWSETHGAVLVTDGIFNVILGSITSFISTVPRTKFEIPYWLEIAVDGLTLSSRIQLTAVPYSITARSVQGYMNVFPSKGNVGIGTTTPGAKLHIVSPNADGIILTDSSTVTYRATLFNWETMGGQLNLNDATGAIQARIRGYASPGGVQASFTAGNVGIGTATPGEKLEVLGNIGVNDYDLYLRSDRLHGIGAYSDTKKFGTIAMDGPIVYGAGGGALGTNDGSLQNIALYWNQAGHVGIGTTSPEAMLHIASPDAGGIILTDASSGRYSATLRNFGLGGQLNLLDSLQTSRARIRGYAYNGVQAYFTAGNVGIGTNSPSAKLEVVGTIKADTLQLSTPAERWYAIPASGFIADPTTSLYNVLPMAIWGSMLSDTMGTYEMEFHAPVHLPHGATIKEFQVGMTDDSPVQDISVGLLYVTDNNSAYSLVASVSSLGQSATFTVTYATSHMVDNQNNTYMVLASWTMPETGAASDLILRNARIKYTVDQPLP